MTIEEYFKNSKIRDKNNNLLICYHGSKNKFAEFDPNKADKGGSLGVGFYFSSSEDVSKYYAEEGQIEKYYLNIINPYYFKKEGSNQMILLKLANELKIKPSDITTVNKQGITGNQFITDKLIEAGYDGVVAEDKDGTLEIVCFKPNQIKSITNQNPTSSNKVNENMKSFTLKDLAKKYNKINKKKNYRGWYEATKSSRQSQGATEIRNAGNVLYNNAFFNQAMGSIDPSANISGVGTADGGIGMVPSAPAGGGEGGAMGESLNSNVSLPTIKNLIEKYYKIKSQPVEGQSYILPDGDFIELNEDSHESVEDIFIEAGLEDEINYSDSPEYSLTLVDNYNAVRVSDGQYLDTDPYIELPSRPLTSQQYHNLENWLYSLKGVDGVFVGSKSNNNEGNFYAFRDYTPEDITKKIKRFYSSGHLYESILNELLDQPFEIIHYVSEEGRDYVQEYLDELRDTQPKLYAKTKDNINNLSRLGFKIREPLSKQIDKELFELRSEAKEGWSRVLYFFIEGKNIILTNGVSKKSNKTPQSAIDLAKKLKNEYLRRDR